MAFQYFLKLSFCVAMSQTLSIQAIGTESVRQHADGSISSNSGPVSIFEQWRPKRQYYSYDAGGETSQTSSGINSNDAQIIVDEHNTYRKTVSASNMQKIYWDTQLAQDAQAYAERCNFGHSTNRVNTGESIWATPILNEPVGRVAVKWWYDEVYKCGCGNGYTSCCAHYSQLVWAETNRIGCGFAVCPSITNAPGQRYYFVCRYTPAGNRLMYSGGQMVSKQAYCYGPTCSACPLGTACNDRLCA